MSEHDREGVAEDPDLLTDEQADCVASEIGGQSQGSTRGRTASGGTRQLKTGQRDIIIVNGVRGIIDDNDFPRGP